MHFFGFNALFSHRLFICCCFCHFFMLFLFSSYVFILFFFVYNLHLLARQLWSIYDKNDYNRTGRTTGKFINYYVLYFAVICYVDLLLFHLIWICWHEKWKKFNFFLLIFNDGFLIISVSAIWFNMKLILQTDQKFGLWCSIRSFHLPDSLSPPASFITAFVYNYKR